MNRISVIALGLLVGIALGFGMCKSVMCDGLLNAVSDQSEGQCVETIFISDNLKNF
ncbi:MAG: hypothetical protein MJ153_03535 [Clostridia bacterium]|nr:hypothetical protein [Clostridia bacterium]